ncbi:hypothetical protein K1T71_010358 [Dendrolimus kikuchii]|uniref:Uncharacterized protein n=1 Tax=Dendrolimus kikuchii TaxID=765133 RepID=A0ACC1CRJ4_9NEOP|nr:hypothetical protein K1T71_010358 [Dendrolimus kikuchii]
MKQRTRLLQNGDDLLTFNMGKKNDIDDNSEIQLYKIKPQDHFIEAQVQEGDTLQAIALRFYCSISELKRINHIQKDNEIFARRTIKVPVTPYSVLTELTPAHPTEPTPSTSSLGKTSTELQLLQGSANGVSQNNSIQKDDDYSIDCNTVVMNSTVAPAIIPYTDTEPTEDVTEDTQLLPNKEKVCVEAVVVKELTSHGADFGLKWFHLVCFILIMGVVVPIVYIYKTVYLDKLEHTLEHTTEHLLVHTVDDLPPLRTP